MKKNRSELTIFLLQLSFFLLPMGLIVPFFLKPGLIDILLDLLNLHFSSYLDNLTDKAHGIFGAFLPLGFGAFLLGFLRFVLQKLVKKHCETKTTVLAFCLGGCASATLFSILTFLVGFFTSGDLHRHPLQISWGFACSLLFFIGAVALLIYYGVCRYKKLSYVAMIFDFVTMIISAFSLFSMGSVALSCLSELARFFEW